MEVLRDQNGNYPVDKSINDNLSDDEVQTYDIERIHRDSSDSNSSERTLYVDPRSAFESSNYANSLDFFSFLDLQDAFKSSIYDKPEVRTCDCATKFALVNNCDNDKTSENQNKPTKDEPQQEPSQPPPQNNIYSYNEVYLLFIFVSVISYVIGYFGLTSVWLLIILYQSIKWYINVTKDHKERVRWEVSREMSMDKVTYNISKFVLYKIFIYFFYNSH
jgi:Ca2+-dependent lipid-binding protein